jgi:hypothetical protein
MVTDEMSEKRQTANGKIGAEIRCQILLPQKP